MINDYIINVCIQYIYIHITIIAKIFIIFNLQKLQKKNDNISLNRNIS